MARQRSPDSLKAEQMYLESGGKLELIDIAKELGVSDGTVRSWKNRYKWDELLNATLQKDKRNVANKKRKRGGQPGNKNAIGNSGGAAPPGNLNAIKHGAYQSLYADMLSPEEKAIYEQTTAEVNIDEEIKLLRLKIVRLLNRDKTFFYDVFGNKIEKELTEEEREAGVLACMDQLRRLIETKATIADDTERLAFDKYKFEVEMQLKKEKIDIDKQKLEIAKIKAGSVEQEEVEDDGFIDALKGEVEEVWADGDSEEN
ncbi:phage terminase small subunit [Fonticella tunisiensis]|uniref:Uncharacterized protein YjcR n=1 Tax=Fonticella tunisiensis TaxID=1096341 RepID=A0A4R7KTR2_9CLOT|nr:phage terminase small subunit [Fonticella tunisiensis]TDT63413.1 uncharacterized protein YjcR [Fonticella tunisiensis]